jgi:hypothetical protein
VTTSGSNRENLIRILLGFGVAPIIPCAALAMLLQIGDSEPRFWFYFGFLYVFGGVLGTLLVGVPALLIFWNRIQHRLRNACIVGAIAALVPFPLLFVWIAAGAKGAPSPIAFSLTVAVMSAVAGAVGGAVFYAIALRPRKTSQSGF